VVRLTEFPEEGELVVGTVREVKPFGAFAALDEFPGKEGFVHIAEVASGWVKYIRDHVREGQKVVCKVTKVDPGKGHIDLSVKQVNEHQRRDKIQAWKNEQRADKLLGIVASRAGMSFEDAVKSFVGDLVATYGSLYGAFEEAASHGAGLAEEGFKGAWVEPFLQVATENIVLPTVTISGALEISTVDPEGIELIRKALRAAEVTGGEAVTIRYLAAPRYRVEVRAGDYKTAEAVLKDSVDTAVESVRKAGGQASFSRDE
jgi:translation initiation factor 2 subunit 1